MSDIVESALRTRIARSAAAIRRSFVDSLFYIKSRRLRTQEFMRGQVKKVTIEAMRTKLGK